VYSAAFKQAGVLRAENLEELFDFVKALIYQPPAKGNRIGIVTCGGGAGVMTVDECVREGLLVPPLPSDLRQKLDELRERGEIPRVAVYRNVIDLSGSVTNGMYGKVLELLLGHPSYDGCIVIALHQPPGLTLGFVDEIAEVARKYEKPVVASSIGISEFAALVRKKLEERGIPVFPLYERAANAMQALVRYGAYLKEGFMS
jgi:acyl-CoA synthetase (NDP forming)